MSRDSDQLSDAQEALFLAVSRLGEVLSIPALSTDVKDLVAQARDLAVHLLLGRLEDKHGTP